MRIDDNWHRYYLSQLLICSVQNFQSIFVYVENKVKESGLALKFRFTRLSLFTIMLHTILLSTYLQLIQLNWNRFLVLLIFTLVSRCSFVLFARIWNELDNEIYLHRFEMSKKCVKRVVYK